MSKKATNAPKKKKREFPNAFTVLFIVLILASVLTYIVPAGLYSRLYFNADENIFEITNHAGEVRTVPATPEALKAEGVSIPFDKFINGDIYKPIAIPNTYQQIKQNPQGIIEFLKSPIEGVLDTVDIIIFVLIIGGNIGLVNKTGAFEAGMAALSRKTKGKEFLLIIIVFSVITLGGTTFGLAEETIAFYPILLPIFIASGYDAMVAIATIYMASSLGTMISTVNPFCTIIASTAAGINFKSGLPIRIFALTLATVLTLMYIYRYAKKVQNDPSKSIIADQMPAIRDKFDLDNMANRDVPEFTLRRKLILIVFALGFPVMIYGDYNLGWWFVEMSMVFLVTGIINMFIADMSENEAVDAFMVGAADLIQVALVVGVARAINIIMDNGLISDTMLYYTSSLINGMNGIIFSWVQMVLFTFLGFFIPSSSGLAVLSMPIFAPLADTVNLGRDVVVSAYNYGQGWMSFLTPTGLILPTLQMVGVTYDKWIKWVIPYMIYLAVFAATMLAIQTVI